TMGLTTLWLVNPKKASDYEALALSGHATEVVNNATIVANLEEALEGVDSVVGTSASVRSVSLPREPLSKVATSLLSY
ncbi:RNA methyltransferase, partial [Francisella tularensis subsp. holarctica]|nr:RNA methyltransferase [Francisella tularensis subsp. holarctica]